MLTKDNVTIGVEWPGDYSADVPPDPIPNSNVKLCCADGTAS